MSDEFGLVLAAGPEDEPVSVAELKSHLKLPLDVADEDDLMARQIAAARAWCERTVHRAFCTQTLRIHLDGFPRDAGRGIVLPRPPLSAVSAIRYVDTAGATQTLAASVYQVSLGLEPARIWPAYGESWPSVRCQRQAVSVEFAAGYGEPQDVPAEARQAVLLMAAHLHVHREIVVTGTIVASVPYSVRSLLGTLDYGWRW